MSKNLFTGQIIHLIVNDIVPAEWAWESALESACEIPEDAVDGARFLEKLEPGRSWSAAEYHGLMYHHFTGRWDSAVEIGRIRAAEAHEEMTLAANGNTLEAGQADRLFDARTASDEAAEKYLRNIFGLHVFEAADGTVLTFDGIVGGVIREEDPS